MIAVVILIKDLAISVKEQVIFRIKFKPLSKQKKNHCGLPASFHAISLNPPRFQKFRTWSTLEDGSWSVSPSQFCIYHFLCIKCSQLECFSA